MIQVYYGWPSIYGRKVLCVLEAKGLDYQLITLDLSKKEHKQPEYLALNPNGLVPTLVDEGLVVYDSTVILEYLEEAYPQEPLLPVDPPVRARARMIEDFIDTQLYVAVRAYFRKWLRSEEPEAGMLETITDHLRAIEDALGERDFLLGDMTVADCAFMPVLPSLEGLGIRSSVLRSDALEAYARRLEQHPAFKGAGLQIGKP